MSAILPTTAAGSETVSRPKLLDPHGLSNDRLIEAFECCLLDPNRFDHESHIRIAWNYLRRHSVTGALDRFSDGLRRFTRFAGVPKKYHETMSWFYVLKISERSLKCRKAGWRAFRAANPDLFRHKGGVLFDFYSKELLSSALARRHFLLPDRPPGRGAELQD